MSDNNVKEIEENSAGVVLTPETKDTLQNKLNEKRHNIAPLKAKHKTKENMI